MTDDNYSKQVAGYLMEHPVMSTAVDIVARRYDFQIDLHVVDQQTMTLARGVFAVGEIVIRSPDNRPLAVIHTNGNIDWLEKEDE